MGTAQSRQGPPDGAAGPIVESIFTFLGVTFWCVTALLGGFIVVDAFEHQPNQLNDFWAFCHREAEGLIMLVMAYIGCCIEVSGMHVLGPFDLSPKWCRVRAGFMYLLIGAYVMGGNMYARIPVTSVTSKIDGILAWVIAVANWAQLTRVGVPTARELSMRMIDHSTNSSGTPMQRLTPRGDLIQNRV